MSPSERLPFPITFTELVRRVECYSLEYSDLDDVLASTVSRLRDLIDFDTAAQDSEGDFVFAGAVQLSSRDTRRLAGVAAGVESASAAAAMCAINGTRACAGPEA